MTLKEKVAAEEPGCVDEGHIGGVINCPGHYPYLNDYRVVGSIMCPVECPSEKACKACWSRPFVEKEEPEHSCPHGRSTPCLYGRLNKDNCKHCGEVTTQAAEETPKNTILDSGARREFETGAVRDIQEGKGRCDLMPLDVVSVMYGYYGLTEYAQSDVFTHINAFTHTGRVSQLFEALRHAHIFDDPNTMFLEAAKQFEDGAKKYGEYNWQKGIPTHCYIDSAVRHYLKWLRGDDDEPHDRAFVWNILCCIWTCIHKPELNDYAKNGGDEDGQNQST